MFIVNFPARYKIVGKKILEINNFWKKTWKIIKVRQERWDGIFELNFTVEYYVVVNLYNSENCIQICIRI